MFCWTDYTIIIHTLKLQQNQILASFWTRNLTKHQWLLLIQCLSEKYKTTFSMDPQKLQNTKREIQSMMIFIVPKKCHEILTKKSL